MITKKEFYFVRHGQTDHNAIEGLDKGDHPEDIALNERGRNQAAAIQPIIATLPIKTICASPLRRVQETKEIIASTFAIEHVAIDDLRECSAQIWGAMRSYGMYGPLPTDGIARQFMDRILNGINEALNLPGPTLVVAHGGIHWALCCLMQIEEHSWSIDNCVPVHFTIADDKWRAKVMLDASENAS